MQISMDIFGESKEDRTINIIMIAATEPSNGKFDSPLATSIMYVSLAVIMCPIQLLTEKRKIYFDPYSTAHKGKNWS